MMDRDVTLDERILAYLAGTIAESELALLDESLRHDDGARARFAELAGQEIDLRDVAIGLAAAPAEVCEKAAGRSLFFRFAAPLAAAASIAVVVGLFVVSRPGRPPVPAAAGLSAAARIESANGTVSVVRGAQTLAAATGQELRAGDKVRTARGAKALVGYAGENTRMDLGAETELAMGAGSPAGGKNVSLASGALSLTVALQPAGRPMVVTTPHAQATVVGTQFAVSVKKDATEFDVRDGAVDVQSARGGAQGRLTAGRLASVEGASGAILILGEVLFTEEFDQGMTNWLVYTADKDGWVKPAAPAMTNAVTIVDVSRDGKPAKCMVIDGVSVPDASINVRCLKPFQNNAVAVDVEYVGLNAARNGIITPGMVVFEDTWKKDKVLFDRGHSLTLNRWYVFRGEYRASVNRDAERVVDSINYYDGRYYYAQQKVYPPGAPVVFHVGVATANIKLAVDRIVVRRVVEKIEPKTAEGRE